MKKSFKRSIAVILSVLMVIASLPFTALAASGEYHPNVVMQYGTIFDEYNSEMTLTSTEIYGIDTIQTYSALKGPALDNNNGTLSLSADKAQYVCDNTGFAAEDYDYTVGDFFTATVRVDNISQLAAFSMAISYSDSIEPAGIYNDSGNLSLYGISDEVPDGADLEIEAGQALSFASANSVYSGINGGLVGELSYVNAEDGYIMAQAAATDGSDSVDLSSGTTVTDFADPETGEPGYTYENQLPVATFIFKIVDDAPIRFSVYDADNTRLPQYTGGLYIANDADGTDVEDYTTYADLADGEGSALLTLEGENSNSGVVSTKYTIVFKSYDGTVISSTRYDDGDTVTIPAKPQKPADDDYHYSMDWDQDPDDVAFQDAVYTAIATPVPHTFDSGVVNGSNKVFTCSACGYQKFEEITECTHNWVAQSETVTTPATCQATGIKSVTYKCSLCQETKVENETIAKTDHSYGDYVYNEDAVYVKASQYTDGTATATCSVCGATTSKTIAGTGLLRANSATVELGAAVKLKTVFANARAAAFDETYLVITFDGEEYIIDEDRYQQGTNDYYPFDKIAPQNFGDQVVLTMYGVKDGIVCKGHPVNYSIKQYATNTLRGSDVKLNTLLVEMLYYAEMAQIYYNYKTDDLITASLTDAQKALHTNYVPSYVGLTNNKYEINSGTNVINWIGVTLGLEGKVIPKFKFRMDQSEDINNYVFKITIAGVTTDITYAEHPEWFEPSTTTTPNNVAYQLRCETLDADQFREAIDVKVTTTTGTVVSNTVRYSVESYATSNTVSLGPQNLKNLVDQLLRYGRADAVYTGKAANYE